MKWISTFYLVVLLSCLGYGENEEINPYAPPPMNSHSQPPKTPTLLSLRDFEYEYDLAMEGLLGARNFSQTGDLAHGVMGFGYGVSGGLLIETALNSPGDLLSDKIGGLPAFALASLILANHMTAYRDPPNKSHAIQEALLAEDRYAHLRGAVDPSEPRSCRASFLQLANPFRLSRIRSRLVPLALGAGVGGIGIGLMKQYQK